MEQITDVVFWYFSSSVWERRRGRRGGWKVGRTHQKARLTIAELFEHGQPDHALRCSKTNGRTASLFVVLADAACLFSARLGLEFGTLTGLDWLTVTTATITSRCRHTGIHRNHTKPPPRLGQQHDLVTQYPHHQRPPLSRLLGWGYDFLTPLNQRLAGNTTHDSQSAKKQQQSGIVESNPSSLGGEERVEKCGNVENKKEQSRELAGDNVGNISPGWASPELKATDATAPD